MFINKEEKVFSLRKTVGAVVRNNLSQTWGELFSLVLLAGLFSEGDGPGCTRPIHNSILDKNLYLSNSAYHDKIADLLAKGITERFHALFSNPTLTTAEKTLLLKLDGIFDGPAKADPISANEIIGVANQRALSDDMKAVAHYLAVMYGSSGFPEATVLPFLYINVFGNIYLSARYSVVVDAPFLVYGDREKAVTPLFSFLSSFAKSLKDTIDENSDEGITNGVRPTNDPARLVGNYLFLGKSSPSIGYTKDAMVTVPRAGCALYMAQTLGYVNNHAPCFTSSFYQNFFFGSFENVKVYNQALYRAIVDAMVPEMGHDPAYTDLSLRLYETTCFYTRAPSPNPPKFLDYALEALDNKEAESDDEDTSESDTPEKEDDSDNSAEEPSDGKEEPKAEDDTERDPATDDNSYDPASPPPGEPVSTPVLQENTIGLISFDRTGEGIDANLYRSAVVSLNDRIQGDEDAPFSAEIKDTLNNWVNRYLYRAAIGATETLLESLKLQEYVKSITTKG